MEISQGQVDDAASGLRRELEVLRADFLDELPRRMERIGCDWQQVGDGSAGNAFSSLKHALHGLAGAAGTFGFQSLGESARRLEASINALSTNAAALEPAVRVAMDERFAHLRALADSCLATGASSVLPTQCRAPGARPLIDLVEDDPVQGSGLSASLRDAGFDVRVVEGLEAFQAAAVDSRRKLPDAVVLDVASCTSQTVLLGLIEALGGYWNPCPPLLVLMGCGDIPSRLATLRAGASRCLGKPIDHRDVCSVLDTLTDRQPETPYRVLLVDDDLVLLGAQAAVLREAGMDVQVLQDPLATLAAVDAFTPDVLLMDVYMPGVGGPEIAALLREHERNRELPILFLSAERDMSRQLLALNLGGDDFLVKPVRPDHLVAAVVARARRARQGAAQREQVRALLYERQREHLALNEHAIVSIANARGEIIYANERFCAISGYRREELIGENHRVVNSGVHPRDFFVQMWRTIASGSVWHGEICNRRKDGSLYWVASTITPFMDTDGRPYQYVSIRTDITAVKAAEAEQRALAGLSSLLAGLAAELLSASAMTLDVVIDRVLRRAGEHLHADRAYLFQRCRDGEHVSNSHEWCAHGIAPQKAVLQDLPVQDFPWFWERMRSGEIVDIPDVAALTAEAAAIKPMLESQDIRALCAFPLQIAGDTVGFIGFDQVTGTRDWDVASLSLLRLLADLMQSALIRTEGERALETAKDRLRRGQLYANIGTWEWNIVTGELFWTERIAPLFGYPKGDLETSYSNFIAAVHPDDRPAVIDAVTACIERDEPYAIEHRVVWPDGTVRWLLERGGVQRDASGKALQMIGVVQDIDDRKQAELALISARESADRANQAKSEFLSSMSHELRTPMNAILGFGQLMELDDGLSDEHRDNLREILRAGRHLLELINEVLDLAKVESGKVDLLPEPVQIDALVEDCLVLVATLADKRSIRLSHQVQGAVVRADRTRLKQVLLNLLSNAIKYNRDRGSVHIDVAELHAGRLRIRVSDTGQGIPSDRVDELFQPFHRLDAEHTGVEGTGIGLTITRRMVELMEGAVGVESEVGVGSTFWVELPRAEADAALAPASDATRPGTYRPHRVLPECHDVLYVEDNPANIKLVSQILERLPHIRLLTAHTPALGLELAEVHRPSVILLDINLPGMDGYRVLELLKADPILQSTPVIAVTANAMPRDIQRGIAAGFADYLTKPLDITRLLESVSRCLGGRSS